MMELIKEAGLNTLLGMGMTFLVLILLSFIISLFGKLLNGFQNKDRSAGAPSRSSAADSAADVKSAPAAAPAEVSGKQEVPAGDGELLAVLAAAVAAYESESFSPEIIAVIAAAVTAYEGTGNGYVVRKIRKSRRHVA